MEENKSLLLEFELDSLKTLEEDDDLAIAEIDLLHLGVNRNHCDISRECVEKSKNSFYNKPIIYRYNTKFGEVLATDFEEHSRDGDATMCIAGHIPYGSKIEYVDRDGKTYVRVTCILHKVYLPNLMRILEYKDGHTKVSIEIVVEDGWQDNDSGVLIIDKFKLRGVCLLGDGILEGIEGSQLNVLKFSNEQYNHYYDSFCKKGDNIVSIKKKFILDKTLLNAKDEYGVGKAIKVNKSKEKLSDTPWSDVDKTKLREEVLKASNYKDLVKDVYMLVEEGWEDSPSTKLKYPVMEIKNGEAFYNRHGLSSALGYAKAEGEQGVVDKIEKIYKDLEIEEEGKEKDSMDNKVIENKLDKDNKDLEEIRDDAEAQEDDVKEELKEKVEEEVKKNEFEPDDEGEEGLEDDVDADKDYWRKKAEENAAQLEELNKRIMALEREKEMACMGDLLKEYQVCLEEEDFKGFEKDMKKLSKDQFSAKLFEHIAKLAKEERLNKEPKMFSYMPAFDGAGIKTDVTLESMSNKYSK